MTAPDGRVEIAATITAASGRTMRPYQAEDMAAIRAEWAAGRTRTALVWATGLGKGHPHDTEIPTPTGLRRFGDLAVGDQVYGVHGDPARVTGVFERGTLPLYRVRFSDDTSVLVDGDHLWEVRDRHRRRRRVCSTATLAAAPLRSADGRSWRWAIPTEAAVDRPDAALPVPPYTLGALIANGHLHGRGSPMLTTPDGQVAMLVAGEGVEILDRTHPGSCSRYLLPGLQTQLAALGLRVPSGEKFLPRDYVERASLAQRVALLRGLMDADGASRPGGRRSVHYFTTSPRLASDVAELVWTLGGTARVRPHERTRDGKQVIEYSINILTPTWLYPFGTDRKEQDERPRRTMRPRRAIVAIEPAGEAPVRCIAVDGPRSLYLIGREHIVTHNTDGIAYQATTAIHEAQHEDEWVLVLAHRRKLLDQITTRCGMYDPNVTVGVVQGQARNQVRRRIVVASEPTMRRGHRRAQLLAAHGGRRPRVVIVDECHHAAAKGYTEVLRWAGCFDELVPTPLLGVTATFTRGDNKGLGDVFQSIAAERDILFGIENGYLVTPYAWEVVGEHVDLNTVKRSGGDYANRALGEMVEQDVDHIVAAWLDKARQPESPLGYRKTIAFTPSVAAADTLAAAFVGAGIPVGVITGAMSEAEQAARYDELHAGRITVLCSVMVPTEGYDEPSISCVLNGRPTEQSGLYAQMVGRGLRPWFEAVALGYPEKVDCLVLDVVGASSRNRLVGLTELVPSAPVRSERDLIPCSECGGHRARSADMVALAEAEGMHRCECERVARDEGPGRRRLQGPGVYDQVDLLGLRASSDLNWLVTPGGVNFLSAGKWLIAIVEDAPAAWTPPQPPPPGYPPLPPPGRTYSVGYCPAWGGAVDPGEVEIGDLAPNRSGVTLTDGVDLDEARQCAEWFALKHNAGGKEQAWRLARKSPSTAQVDLARRLGIAEPESYTAGGLSDAIDVARAAARFDR